MSKSTWSFRLILNMTSKYFFQTVQTDIRVFNIFSSLYWSISNMCYLIVVYLVIQPLRQCVHLLEAAYVNIRSWWYNCMCQIIVESLSCQNNQILGPWLTVLSVNSDLIYFFWTDHIKRPHWTGQGLWVTTMTSPVWQALV